MLLTHHARQPTDDDDGDDDDASNSISGDNDDDDDENSNNNNSNRDEVAEVQPRLFDIHTLTPAAGDVPSSSSRQRPRRRA